MKFMTRLLLAGVVTIGIGATVTPAETAAQCTMRCLCVSAGCGCSSNGGDGSGCSAGGGACFVTTCPLLASLDGAAFAPDGSVLPRQVDTGSASVDASSAQRVERDELPESPLYWETLPSGIAVAKNCAGLVVRRYVQTAQALALRDDTRVLTTQD